MVDIDTGTANLVNDRKDRVPKAECRVVAPLALLVLPTSILIWALLNVANPPGRVPTLLHRWGSMKPLKTNQLKVEILGAYPFTIEGI